MARPRAGLGGARLTIILAMLVMLLLAPSQAGAAPSEFYGIAQGALDREDVKGMAAAGVHTERFLLRWKSIEPTRGSFDWSSRDRSIGRLAARGIRPMPFVWGSPSWVGSGALAQPPLNNPGEEQAWQDFLRRAVARYGPGGTYWGAPYHQQFPGAADTPMPVQSWQIWNEPNLKKFFTPGANVDQSAQKYAQLLKLSHDAILAKDPQAQIVLAGMPGYGDSKAWVFLDHLYLVAGVKSNFDAAALHPYARNIDEFRREIRQFRASMTSHGDAATPLWLTELAWGSGPPDQFGHNVGPSGQEQMLNNAFRLILNNRTAWNIQRVFWFLWRDPAPGSYYAGLCSICGTAGLLKYSRGPKLAFSTFKRFTADTTPPGVSINSGPAQDSTTSDPTPSFGFGSAEAGSTFECQFTGQNFAPCSSPFSPSTPLSDGTQTFFVKAIDAAGNESAVRSRRFTVDTMPPAVTISSGPAEGSTSPARSASFGFDSSDSTASLSCQLDSGGFAPCSSPYGASQLADGQHTFEVRATDQVGNTGSPATRTWTVGLVITSGPSSGAPTNDPTPTFTFSSPDSSGFSCSIDGAMVSADCSSPFTSPGVPDGSHTLTVAHDTESVSRHFQVDTTPPAVTMSSGPGNGSATNDATPTFRFSSSESPSTFQCRFEGHAFSACSGAGTDTPSSPLRDGRHSFYLKALDAAQNQSQILSRSFTVDTVAPNVRIRGPERTTSATTRRRRRSARVTFILQSSESVSLHCRIDSRPFKPCSSPYMSPKLKPGHHRLKVRAKDQAGNVGASRKRFVIERRHPRRRLSLVRVPSGSRCHGVPATLIGTRHGDVLRGTNGPDVILGLGGNDTIDGRGGSDLICGRHGDDYIRGGSGQDRILGGPGSDHIRSGVGFDMNRGGSGSDSCAGATVGRTFRCERSPS